MLHAVFPDHFTDAQGRTLEALPVVNGPRRDQSRSHKRDRHEARWNKGLRARAVVRPVPYPSCAGLTGGIWRSERDPVL